MLEGVQFNNNVLFTFDMLVDIDIGLLRVIAKKYNDKRYFYEGILTDMTLDEQKYILSTRTDFNPLSVLSKIEDIDERYKLYEQIMDKEYINILNESVPTGIVELFRKYIYSSGVILPCVLCKNEDEEKCIERILKGIDKTTYGVEICKDISTFDASIFDTIYLKSYADILQFNNINGKNIVISSCNYNMMELEGELVPNPEISIEIVETNELTIINLYVIPPEALGEG